jgi:phosphoglycolate phosphatase-like HAD superfamily hydrolase
MKAVIFDRDTLVQKNSSTPLPGVQERLATLRNLGLPLAIATARGKTCSDKGSSSALCAK